MLIIGAGIAGLLAANLLRHKSPTVLEAQPQLPNNHSAVLRFRSSIISDVTGIPFRKVQVFKASLPWLNPVADALAYAEKNTSVLRSDRSIPMQMTSSERYIAPPDLIARLAAGLNIRYAEQGGWNSHPVISTIPMPSLMKILNYPEPQTFASVVGSNIRGRVLNCEAYSSLYVPNPMYPFSRVSLTGDEIIAEVPISDFNDSEALYSAAGLLGISKERIVDVKVYKQVYAKILPIDEGHRTRFIMWATDKHNIYSLGRYSVWKPQLLLDDLVNDIRLIERWINSGSNYMVKQKQYRS